MNISIDFPQDMPSPRELALYGVIAPAWTAASASKQAQRFGLRAEARDAGPWLVCADERHTLEIYQASHSVRLERNGFDAEGRQTKSADPISRDRARSVAERFLDSVGDAHAQAELASITELRVLEATKEQPKGVARIVGLQVNYRYRLDGLALVGPGAKAQVTVGNDGELGQAYRFARQTKLLTMHPAVDAQQAFERFARSARFADLRSDAKVKLHSAKLGLLCLPPTEVQGLLMPVYVLQGEVSTEALPSEIFTSYVAAVDIDARDAKRQRWLHTRPGLIAA